MNQTLQPFLPYIFLAMGIAFAIIGLFVKSSKSNLIETGIPVDGIIYEQEYNDNLFQSDNSNANKDITVRFVTLEKEWITAKIDQGFQFSYTGQYKNGNAVKVYYDKTNPYNFYVDTKQSEKKSRIIFILVGILIICIAVYKLLANSN